MVIESSLELIFEIIVYLNFEFILYFRILFINIAINPKIIVEIRKPIYP